MAKLLLPLVLGIGLFTVIPASPVEADFGALPQINIAGSFDATDSFVGWGDFWSWLSTTVENIRAKIFGGSNSGGITPGGSSRGAAVPELDMNVAGSAIVLLFGGVAYIASRRRKLE